MSILRLIFLLLGLALMVPAQAGSKDQAEYQRLTEEIEKLAGRNAWSGVDRAYEAMVELSERGVKLRYEDHLLGAHASKSLGHINNNWVRLNRANAVNPTEESFMMLATLAANYGPVRLCVKKNYDKEATLVAKDLGFMAEQRQVVEQARKSLAEEGEYVGLLPLGRYIFGEEPFDIIGGPEVEITLKKQIHYVY